MIFGIGTDIVRIPRMVENLSRYGERFAARILTEAELAIFCGMPLEARRAQFLAKRFAAKEAAAKALGTGFRDGLSLHDIGVVNDALGKPTLAFSGKAQQILDGYAIGTSHLSLADETEYAIAYVLLETAINPS
ncbi:MAG: holo-ACP synthase [Ectothiorhodospiraceae bacterium]|nr:holo-ACP synthase [Ectothiorhodospiraceae bacterium]